MDQRDEQAKLPPPREHCISRMPTYRPNDLSSRFNPHPHPHPHPRPPPSSSAASVSAAALHRLPNPPGLSPLAYPPQSNGSFGHNSSSRSDPRIIGESADGAASAASAASASATSASATSAKSAQSAERGGVGSRSHSSTSDAKEPPPPLPRIHDHAHHRHLAPTHLHLRTHSHIAPVTPNRPRLLPRALSFPLPSGSSSPSSPAAAADITADDYHSPKPVLGPDVNASNRPSATTKQPKARVLRRNNGLEKQYPPPAMITQGSYRLEIDTTSTTDWVASQQIAPSPSTSTSRTQPPQSPAQPLSARSFESGGSRPLIKPIRGFKPSSRKSTEITMRRTSGDADNTLRTLEYSRPRRISDPSSQEEPTSDDSDMFLRAAKEEELSRQVSNAPLGALSRSNSKGSRVTAQRSSLPPSNTLFQSSLSRRRGSDNDSSSPRGIDDQGNGNVGQVLTYKPEKDRASTALDDVNRTRFYGSTTRSPTTPRGLTSREPSIESAAYQGRRGSLPDPSPVLPSRPSYRQSNLSYSTPRNYNSSPLVSRAMDMQEAPAPETIRAAEGTESTVSTTAPSTVWDELEDLKSRIHRLELTGKLPPTSGAAMSRASHDRPPTATTTVTTMSTSPKQRGSGNSVSPVEAMNKQVPPSELHPLLHAALAKSKPLLAPEVFSALEATTSDALAIASMMGTSGQPGPLSSAQSTIDRPTSTVSDRQVRRKADSMCRNLTELCIALSDGKAEHTSSADTQTVVRPRSGDTEVQPSMEQVSVARQPISNELARIKASPRALSRLEARRSSLLNTTTLPSPRYAPSETGTPTQTSMAGRRTSLYIRSRRANTEEPEEKDSPRFRAPSRAITEIGRFKNAQKEHSQEPLPERTTAVQSTLPVRRHGHVATSSLPNTAQSPTIAQSNIGGRRYLERGTPERDTTGPIGRFVEERGQRKSSIGQGFGLGRAGSLNRRKREQTNSTDYSAASQNYQ